MELIMFQATLCSSSAGQMYEYNFWYNHSVLVAVQYAGQDRTHQATMFSSSGGQLYEYNFWYNHSVLVAVRYAGQDGTHHVSSNHVLILRRTIV